MVDFEFVAVGTETPARLTDLGVTPKPGGEGEQAKPDYRRQVFGGIGFMIDGRMAVGVSGEGGLMISTKRAPEPWVMQGVAFARALPAKEKK
jgi:hypothetical protein